MGLSACTYKSVGWVVFTCIQPPWASLMWLDLSVYIIVGCLGCLYMCSTTLNKLNVAVGVCIQVGWLGGLYVRSTTLGKPGSQRVYIQVG